MLFLLARLCRSAISQAFLSHCGRVEAGRARHCAAAKRTQILVRKTGAIPMRSFIIAAVTAVSLSAPALGQATPETENGRYTFSAVPDGQMRLDTRTGQVSLCAKQTSGWACSTVPDERSALENEIVRLQRENGALKKDMLARNLPLPKDVTGLPTAGQQRELNLKVPMPSDAEIDRVMSAFEKMWRRLVDMVQKSPGSDKI
jgi:hypothetical protein